MVPEVGREAAAEVRGSIEAMAELTKRLIASGAETVVLISPHAPLEPDAFVAYQGPVLHGDFANFRALRGAASTLRWTKSCSRQSQRPRLRKTTKS